MLHWTVYIREHAEARNAVTNAKADQLTLFSKDMHTKQCWYNHPKQPKLLEELRCDV